MLSTSVYFKNENDFGLKCLREKVLEFIEIYRVFIELKKSNKIVKGTAFQRLVDFVKASDSEAD